MSDELKELLKSILTLHFGDLKYDWHELVQRRRLRRKAAECLTSLSKLRSSHPQDRVAFLQEFGEAGTRAVREVMEKNGDRSFPQLEAEVRSQLIYEDPSVRRAAFAIVHIDYLFESVEGLLLLLDALTFEDTREDLLTAVMKSRNAEVRTRNSWGGLELNNDAKTILAPFAGSARVVDERLQVTTTRCPELLKLGLFQEFLMHLGSVTACSLLIDIGHWRYVVGNHLNQALIGQLDNSHKNRLKTLQQELDAAEQAKQQLRDVELSKKQGAIQAWSDAEMIAVLQSLCDNYSGKQTPSPRNQLELDATLIGKVLNDRGGMAEMRRLFRMLSGRPGSRTLEMHWANIGEWRG